MPVPAPVATEPPPRLRAPLRAWLVPLGPVLLVFLVAAAFGTLLGLPGSGSEQAATTVRSPQQDAVQRLAMAYGRAADHVTSPALVSAAKEASLAYLALESAARAGDQAAYDSARARVEAAERQVESELAQINRSRTGR